MPQQLDYMTLASPLGVGGGSVWKDGVLKFADLKGNEDRFENDLEPLTVPISPALYDDEGTLATMPLKPSLGGAVGNCRPGAGDARAGGEMAEIKSTLKRYLSSILEEECTADSKPPVSAKVPTPSDLPVKVPQPQMDAPKPFCPNCGSQVKPNHRFCPFCSYNLLARTPNTQTLAKEMHEGQFGFQAPAPPNSFIDQLKHFRYVELSGDEIMRWNTRFHQQPQHMSYVELGEDDILRAQEYCLKLRSG